MSSPARLRTARKEHRCLLCARAIPRGTRYRYCRVTPWGHPLNDGFFDYRAHERCDEFFYGEYGQNFEMEFPVGEEVEFRRACWRYFVRKARRERKRERVPDTTVVL